MKPGNGAVVLVLGILAWCGLHFFTGIPAWIIGNQSLKEMDAGLMNPSDRSMVQAGRILGMISTLLSLGALCLVGTIWLVIMVTAESQMARSGLIR